MMPWECTSTCYVLLRIVAVPASGPKDRADMGRLS
jgi:hypothetical protein